MHEYLLKRALPFTLTFVVGAAVGGSFQLFGAGGPRPWSGRHSYTFEGRHGCDKKFRRRAFEAAPASRRPVILFKPDARWPDDHSQVAYDYAPQFVRVSVTFGDDGKVRAAKALDGRTRGMNESAERAAWQMRFNPATVDGVPTTITEEVVIRVSDYGD